MTQPLHDLAHNNGVCRAVPTHEARGGGWVSKTKGEELWTVDEDERSTGAFILMDLNLVGYLRPATHLLDIGFFSTLPLLSKPHLQHSFTHTFFLNLPFWALLTRPLTQNKFISIIIHHEVFYSCCHGCHGRCRSQSA
jgi:hypothetical protein